MANSYCNLKCWANFKILSSRNSALSIQH